MPILYIESRNVFAFSMLFIIWRFGLFGNLGLEIGEGVKVQ